MNNLLNNSSNSPDVNLKKDESDNEKEFLDENLKVFNVYNQKETKYINKDKEEDIPSFSISPEGEEFPNLYKIPKNKLFNLISPGESNHGKLTKNKKNKTTRNKDISKNINEIIKVIFSTPKKTVKDKIIIVSELDKDFAIYENDNTLDEIKSRHYDKDMIKKRQNELKKEIRKNMRLFITENEEKKNKNDIPNNNNKNMNEIPKSKDKKKTRYKKDAKNINQALIDTSHILSKLKKNQTFEKRNINNTYNNISLKKRNKEKKINVDGCINLKKISCSRLNDGKIIKKRKGFEDKRFYFLNKNFKNLIYKKNEFNNYLNTFNYTLNNNNTNSSSEKIRREYSLIKKRRMNIYKQVKTENTPSVLKNKKLKINWIGLNNKNQNCNYSFKSKKTNSKIKDKSKNVIKMPIKVNISTNDLKIKKYMNINLSSNIRKIKPKFVKNINKSSLLLKTRKIVVHKKV